MYTNCPECGTVFRISINELRVAEGYVRCGHCAATFNALATLVDELPPTVTLQQLTLPTEPESDSGTREKPEPEAPHDTGLPTEPARPEISPVPEAAATYVPLPASEDTLEFDIPEESWSGFFAPKEPAGDGVPHVGAEADALPASESDTDPEASGDEPPKDPVTPVAPADVGNGIGSETVDQVGLYRALTAEAADPALDQDADWETLLAEVQDDEAAPESVYVISDDPPGQPATEPALAWDEPPDTGNQSRTPEPLPADFAADLARDEEPAPAAPAQAMPALDLEPLTADRPFLWKPPTAPTIMRSGWHRAYAAGSAVLALLVVIQVLHLQRDELATNPALTEALQRTYGALGLTLWPAWDLRAYQVRNSEAVADRSSAGALDILARIAVVGDDPVGLPFVRVTLRDALSRPLGTRVFNPDEYLGKNPRPREPVSPGTLIPVEINLKDPGRDALGFDVDVCIMSQRKGMICRAEPEPFVR